ncbi:SxtJ family membrane protein [Spirulina sp. CS-785/01]|uniref:SxtJ family membrane protein n=1 Tax=Spirulina sp. CS-785/01 TaxID=3021716 RepID=UPI00232F997A|nr:SxtJ family membrane protein [Spirulina sp. CS-785/01]MDB9312309.1 SxtJ family membrane protein [Spirulina sp. CS-785/01]
MAIAIPQSKKELRQFGMLLGSVIPLLFGVLLPWIWGHGFPLVPWILGAVFWGLALIVPKTFKPVAVVWIKVATVLAWLNTRLILGIIFFLMVTPMALVMRLIGRDPLSRTFERQLESYRVTSQLRTQKSMEKPF